jgi:hypothetical protein
LGGEARSLDDVLDREAEQHAAALVGNLDPGMLERFPTCGEFGGHCLRCPDRPLEGVAEVRAVGAFEIVEPLAASDLVQMVAWHKPTL